MNTERTKRTEFRYHILSDDALARTDLAALDLSARAYHCLRRAGITTVGELAEGFCTRADQSSCMQLRKIRGLGKNTAQEILWKLFEYQVFALPEKARDEYLRQVAERNR